MSISNISGVVAGIMGKIGTTVYNRRTKKGYVARTAYKEGAPTEKQKEQRLYYQQCDILWGSLTEEQKNEWKKVTWGKGHTRYSTFMSVNLKRARAGLPLKRTP